MKTFIRSILICITAGTLNYGLCWFAQKIIGIPIYFDTVIVMAILFTFGFWPSLGTLTIHFLFGIFHDYYVFKVNSYLYLYFIPGVFIIVITWLFSRKKENLRGNVNSVFLYLLCACYCSAIMSSFTGGIINYLIIMIFEDSENFWVGQELILFSQNINKNLLTSLITGRIPITCLDRMLTTFAGFGLSFIYKKITF